MSRSAPWESACIAAYIPEAKVVLYSDAGHGFLFQPIDDFVHEVDRFLD